MNKQDKPFWGPVAALLARVGLPFSALPTTQLSPRPCIAPPEKRVCVNDDAFFQPPGVA